MIKIILQDGRSFVFDEKEKAIQELRQSMPPLSDIYYDGIDVSQWQSNIDWEQVAKTNIHMVYIRAAKGGERDWQFEEHYKGAKAAGLKIGFSYFITANDPTEAREQARYFFNVTKGKDYNLRLVGAYEALGNHEPDEVNAIALSFFNELEGLAGHRPMLYASPIGAGEIFGYDMSYYPLWLARSLEFSPHHPDNWKGWHGYQYGETGEFPGIDAFVDKNFFIDDVIIR